MPSQATIDLALRLSLGLSAPARYDFDRQGSLPFFTFTKDSHATIILIDLGTINVS